MTEKVINQRARLTRQLLKEALLRMMKKQKINKISIRELCQVAGINRTTFYNHYGSQYDVFNEIVEDYIQSTSYEVMNGIREGKNIVHCWQNNPRISPLLQ